MKWFLRYKLHHVAFWMAYFIFWTYVSKNGYGADLSKAVLATFIYFLGQAGVGYLSIYWLVPRFFFTKKYIVFAALVLGSCVLGSLLIDVGMRGVFPDLFARGGNAVSFNRYFLYCFIAVFFSTILFIAARVIKERVQAQKMNSILEKEKTEHELKFLKSQINPHFLFNAINSIYVLITKDPALAAATLARFSDMLRYQLYECNFMEVPVEKEIAYLNNYIELEKLRKEKSLMIDYTVDLDKHNFVISPFLIIPFVENAFKHVSNFTDKVNYITITLNYQAGFFKLVVRNSIDSSRFEPIEHAAGGIGQDNTKRRLQLIYPGRHQLNIEKTEETYLIVLTIQIP